MDSSYSYSFFQEDGEKKLFMLLLVALRFKTGCRRTPELVYPHAGAVMVRVRS
jgi:hypothetical protein